MVSFGVKVGAWFVRTNSVRLNMVGETCGNEHVIFSHREVCVECGGDDPNRDMRIEKNIDRLQILTLREYINQKEEARIATESRLLEERRQRGTKHEIIG